MLIALSTCFVVYGQGFQVGYAAGVMVNYTATNYNNEWMGYSKNTNLLNGIFIRYDSRTRWSVSLNGCMFNKNFTASGFFEDLSINPTSYGWQTYTIDGSYYLLDLSLQYNINSNAALHNKKFKGVKSYLGLSYTGILDRRYIHGTNYNMTQNTYIPLIEKQTESYRAIGLSNYAAYNASKKITISLSLIARLNTEDLTPVGGKVEYKELDPDYYLSAAVGIAYRFAK